MSVSPRIGVVIPVFHGADDLRQTLTAFRALPTHVLAQLEVVVADGASTDDTLNVMSTFMDVIRHADSRKDLGVYDAMNRGAGLVQAPYVWFLGAGDLPLAEGLLTLLGRLEGDMGHACTVLAMAPREPGVPTEFVPQFGKSLD
ncbi:MAG: glycosyltransferase, partial [Flavobacteriales bacterium]|nr:glycosyltransferase [Flavobacteriales bacterium]